jgi:glycosyltransferase involved in cell wall biosynthesis
MKIAHVVDSMEVGGAETLVSQMCQVQRERGHDASIYAIGALGPLGERMRGEGFAVEANVGRHLLEAPRRLFRIFKEMQPSVVHLHNPTPTINGAVSARLAGVQSILSTWHNLAAPRRFAVELEYAVAATCCDWIVGICDATTNNLRKRRGVPARKIVRVYNCAFPLNGAFTLNGAFPLNGVRPIDRAASERWPHKNGFTLVYVGRLAPVKNHALMFHAFREALATMPSLRLWVVGDGSERTTLEGLARELGISAEVSFWGEQLDVAPYFSAADAFIMSSKSEGLPVALIQAFSVGLPAIVTDVGGMAEVVGSAQAGLIVPATDAAEMAKAILRLAGNDGERERFSRNAEAAFHSRFRIETMVDAYMDLYRNTAGARRMESE